MLNLNLIPSDSLNIAEDLPHPLNNLARSYNFLSLKQTKPPKKPKRQTKGYIREAYEYARNQAKWKMAKEFCADRQWEFKVVTEKELGI